LRNFPLGLHTEPHLIGAHQPISQKSWWLGIVCNSKCPQSNSRGPCWSPWRQAPLCRHPQNQDPAPPTSPTLGRHTKYASAFSIGSNVTLKSYLADAATKAYAATHLPLLWCFGALVQWEKYATKPFVCEGPYLATFGIQHCHWSTCLQQNPAHTRALDGVMLSRSHKCWITIITSSALAAAAPSAQGTPARVSN
jgi:hypothetical protein